MLLFSSDLCLDRDLNTYSKLTLMLITDLEFIKEVYYHLGWHKYL